LDEYQDTSHAQLTLLASLFGGGHPVVAVGDPCQAIYGWRGASAGNLARFPGDFPLRYGRPASVVPLSTSWRNAPAVLAAANALSAPLRGEVIPELRPAPHRPDAGLVRLALCETVVDEATWIADQLAVRWHAAPAESGPESMAVLLRTRAQIKRYADALSGAGLPVEVVGIGGLLEVPEVADVMATIRVLCDPTASTALLRLLTGARWRIGPRDLAALAARARQLAKAAEPDDGLAAVQSDQLGIIDALEDLGSASAYSAEGRVRLRSLRDELRQLRGFLNRPLPELVAAVEDTLGIGVEVTVRDALDASASRAHLDEFSSVVASFAESAQLATATALLAYLDAAQQHERGLPPGRVEVHRGAVQLLTVHAAKGLEWDVVAVPGMCEGSFPAAERTSGLWTKNSGVLPFELRGDRGELPSLRRTEVTDLTDLSEALERLEVDWAHHRFTEERRLAYVAVTRARSLLLCSGYWWSDGVKPKGPSTFLTEIVDRAHGAGTVPSVWADKPDEDAANPLATQPTTAEWPADPLGERRAAIAAGAELVAVAARIGPVAVADARRDESGRQWLEQARLLLAEREELHKSGPVGVRLPDQLSVSQLVAVGRDPRAVAAQLRRPIPRPPATHARRGTAFHSWLERRFGSDQLFDLGELPGSADEDAAPDADLSELQAAFERSEWAGRTPSRVEVSFSMTLPTQQPDDAYGVAAAGIVLRGRMDAVFAVNDHNGASWEVVDWKTGRAPTGAAAKAASVQLAVYRLAWAELAGVDLVVVRAGFHYIRENRTVCPVDLLDREGLVSLISALPED
ncbi:MAG: ATP-dependent helicase, partial [Mycobacteriales bacterium]